jgi:hypothetical protein
MKISIIYSLLAYSNSRRTPPKKIKNQEEETKIISRSKILCNLRFWCCIWGMASTAIGELCRVS